jgi:hypothetical protein
VRGYQPALRYWNDFRHSEDPEKSQLSIASVYLLGETRLTVTLKIIEFLDWLTESQGIRPHDAASYLTGVRHGFVIHLGDGEAFDDGNSIKLARKACRAKTSRAELTTAVHNRIEIQPLLPSQLDWMRSVMWCGDDATIDSKMTYVAVALSQDVALRIGEVVSEGPYVGKSTGAPLKTDHRFIFDELMLEDSHGTSYQIDTYFTNMPRLEIVYFRLDAISTKTSHRVAVRAKPYQFSRTGTSREIQFFDDFIEWIELSGVRTLESPIFSRVHPHTKRYAEAQGKDYRHALKRMAVHFDLDPDLYSGKSTRKGGATSMHAAGRSDADILSLVGHSNIATTVQHYMADNNHRGNSFGNNDDEQVTIAQLKRSLPARMKRSHPSSLL